MSTHEFVFDKTHLNTPCVVIDLAVAERNMARAQAHFDTLGIAMRPHIKTHKLPQLARRQVALGATGLTCQKLGEAEVMAEAGFDDIFLPYNLLGEAKLARLKSLAGQVRLSASAEVAPLDNGRFRVMVGDQVADFDTESQALAHAGERAAAMAVDLALSAGAAEAHAVVTRDIRASDLDGQRFLVAATVTATASGRPRLATG